MQLTLINLPVYEMDEDPAMTVAYIDSKRSADPIPNVNVAKCQFYQRGNFIILEYADKIHYWEHINYNYGYLEEAIFYFNLERPAKWKTLDRLVIFRKAIRENTAQGMGLDDMLQKDINYKQYSEFIRQARYNDRIHHGQPTF